MRQRALAQVPATPTAPLPAARLPLRRAWPGPPARTDSGSGVVSISPYAQAQISSVSSAADRTVASRGGQWLDHRTVITVCYGGPGRAHRGATCRASSAKGRRPRQPKIVAWRAVEPIPLAPWKIRLPHQVMWSGLKPLTMSR